MTTLTPMTRLTGQFIRKLKPSEFDKTNYISRCKEEIEFKKDMCLIRWY